MLLQTASHRTNGYWTCSKQVPFLTGCTGDVVVRFCRTGLTTCLFSQASVMGEHGEQFGTVIEDADDTNVESEKELSLEQKLELAITKKILNTKIPNRNHLYPKPPNEK
ncbi:hypothetical protein TNCV_3018421 [Trichonephila clavipes]|nr:hypothetical protein TNCV_3018421 [Trichonephila clavipes]